MEKRKLVPLSDILDSRPVKPEPQKTIRFCELCIDSRKAKTCQLKVSVEEFITMGNVGGAQDLPKMPQFIDCNCPYIEEVKKEVENLSSIL